MGFGGLEILSELTLGDVGDEAEMGSGGLDRPVHIEAPGDGHYPKRSEAGAISARCLT